MGISGIPVRFVRGLFAVLLLLLLYVVFHLTYFGFPDAAMKSVVDAAVERGYFIQCNRMTLSVPDGVSLRNVRVFRRGVVGPPFLEADEVGLGFRLRFSGVKGAGGLRTVRVRNGLLRRDASYGDERVRRTGGRPFSWALVLDDCNVQGLSVRTLVCDVKSDGADVVLGAIRGVLGRGVTNSVRGDISYNWAARTYSGSLTTDVYPAELKPYLKRRGWSGLERLLDTFAFSGRPPRVRAEFTGSFGPAGTTRTKVTADFASRDMSRNGVEAQHATARVTVDLAPDRRTVELSPLVIQRAEGRIGVSMKFDLIEKTVQFSGAATADPVAVAQLIHPRGPEQLTAFTFGGPVAGTASGVVSYTNAAKSRVKCDIKAERLGFWRFVAERCAFKVVRFGKVLLIADIDAELLGGKLNGAVAIQPDPESTNKLYHATFDLATLDLRQVAEALSEGIKNKEGYQGELSGNIEVSGIAAKGNDRSIGGKGSLAIRNGNILRLPLFGQLSRILVKVVPGLDYVLRQNSADTSFKIDQGKVMSDDIRIEGDILSLKAAGTYDLPSKEMDFGVELRFLKKKHLIGKLTQTLLLPVSKLFKVWLRGTPEDPRWSAVNF